MKLEVGMRLVYYCNEKDEEYTIKEISGIARNRQMIIINKSTGKERDKMSFRAMGKQLFFEKEHALWLPKHIKNVSIESWTEEEKKVLEMYQGFDDESELEELINKLKEEEEREKQRKAEEERINNLKIAEKKQAAEKAEKEIKNKSEIEEIIKKRNITDIVHFTRVENLESILENGILSRNELKKRNIFAMINDYYRQDGMLDYSSFSITFPNNKMFYNKRRELEEEEPGAAWAVICLKPEVILENDVKFCETNAANSYSTKSEKAEEFEKMFEEKKTIRRKADDKKDSDKDEYKKLISEGKTPKELVVKFQRGNNTPENFTTDIQAEIMIQGTVESKYIKCIIFENENNKDNSNISNKILCKVDKKYFEYRIDNVNEEKEFIGE